MPAWLRRHRVKAARLALSLGPNAILDQEQEPKAPGSEAGGGRGLGKVGLKLKRPLAGSEELLEIVLALLGPNRLPLLIGIDGADGLGKSSLASWLAWQLGAPAIHLDLYLVKDSEPLQWRIPCLQRILSTRLDEHAKPLVLEGIMLLEALAKIGRRADFLVYVEGEGGYSLSAMLSDYRARHQPEKHAQLRLHAFVEDD
jgi:hypothetical protein